MPRKDSIPASSSTAQAQQEAISDGIENYELPKTLVTRIAKSSIPEQAKLQKETVTALVKGSTVFINYLSATAHDIASSRQHKTISASDVLKALEMIQFGDMVEPLQQELQVFRENTKSAKKGSKAGAAGANGTTGGSANTSGGRSAKGAQATTKGKGRAGPSPLSTSVSATGAQRTDGDEVVMGDAQDGEGAEDDGDDNEEAEPGEGEEEDELADDVDVEEEADEDEGEGEGEELEDRMAVEEDELKQDERRANLGEGARDGE